MLEDRVSNSKNKCRNTLKSEGTGLDVQTGVCILQEVHFGRRPTESAILQPQHVTCDLKKPTTVVLQGCDAAMQGAFRNCLFHWPSGLGEQHGKFASK